MRLVNVLHTDKKLTLVFEFLDQDLKKLLDKTQGPLPEEMVKVSILFFEIRSSLLIPLEFGCSIKTPIFWKTKHIHLSTRVHYSFTLL